MIFRVSIDAFAASPEVEDVLKEVRADRAFARSRFNVLDGGLAAAIAHYADKPTPQVIVVEEKDDDAVMLGRLDQLAEVCEPGTRVVVIGALNDIRLYRTLVAHGVSEYLLLPVNARQLVETLSGLFADPSASPKGRTIAFWGARGGVGASALAQNTAWCLGSLLQEDVNYVDFDLAFGTSVLAFNVDAKHTIAEALAHPDRLDGVLMERFMAAYDDHLHVLASPADMRAGTVVVDGEAVDKVLDLASRMGAAVVADLPHLWTDWTEQVLAAADEVVVVATPDLPCLRDTKAIMELLAQKRGSAAPPKLVLNRMDAYRKTQLSPKDFEETLGVAPVMTIPFDPLLFGEASNNGQMVGEIGKTHKVTDQLRQLAAMVAAKGAAARKPKAKAAAPALSLAGLIALVKKSAVKG